MTEQQIDRDRLQAVADHAEQANSAVYLAPRGLRDLLDQLDQAEARIKAVRDMHTAVKLGEHSGSFISAPDDHLVCAHCTDPDAGGYMDYPCETLRALDGER